MSSSRVLAEAAIHVAELIVLWTGLEKVEQSDLLKHFAIGINGPQGLDDALEWLYPKMGILAASAFSAKLQEQPVPVDEGAMPHPWPEGPHFDQNNGQGSA